MTFNLVAEAVGLEERGELVLFAHDVVVVLDQELLDQSQLLRAAELRQSRRSRPLDRSSRRTRVVDVTRETHAVDRPPVLRHSVWDRAHTKRAGIGLVVEEVGWTVRARERLILDLHTSKSITRDVVLEARERCGVRLERQDLGPGIERLEVEDRHPDVAAAIDDERRRVGGREQIIDGAGRSP